MKIFFRNIHLYLSLVSGLIIAVVCLTGGVLVFEKDLEQAWHRERYFVEPATSPRMPLQLLASSVHIYKPGAKISGIKVYADPSRTVEFSLAGAPGSDKGDKKEGRGNQGAEARVASATASGDASRQAADHQKGRGEGKGEKGGKGGKGGEGGPGGPKVFVNPYTGTVTGELNYRETFFFTVMALHRGMVGGPIGKLIVGISTVMFLFIIATGIVLWWPATRKVLEQRLKVKWSGSWKRVNHDLHIVLGFYSALFLFVFAFTGLAWSFEWFNKGIYAVTNSPMQRPEPPLSTVPTAAEVAASQQPVVGPSVASGAPLSPEAALQLVARQVPEAQSYALQLPKDSTGSIRVATLRRGASYENATDDLYLDQYSGKVLSQQPYEQRSLGQRVRGIFKPVHTGAVFGLPSKIIALVVCVLGFTFPITGTILWLNRLRKVGKKQRKQEAAVAAM